MFDNLLMRRRTSTAAGAVTLLLLLLLGPVPASARDGARARQPAIHVLWRAHVADNMLALAAGAGAVWVSSAAEPQSAKGRLFRLDPSTGKRLAAVPVGWAPSSVAVGAGGVWVADSIGDGSRLKDHLPGLENAVSRISPRSNRVTSTIRLPFVETLIAGYGSLWATTLAGSAEVLVRIDPATTRVVQKIRLSGADGPLAVGGGRLWALTWNAEPTERASISEIDPDTGSIVRRITVSQGGAFSTLTYRNGVLLVGMVNRGPAAPRGRLVSIDLRSAARRTALVAGARALAWNTAGIWAAGNQMLSNVDAGTLRVRSALKLRVGPDSAASIASDARQLWLTDGADVLAVG